MTTARLAPRTALFLPASNPRAIEKARGLAADLIILDLEDAVRPEAKADARGAAVAAVAQGFGPHLVATRINGIDSAEHGADLEAVAASTADFAVLPKAETALDTAAVAAAPATEEAPAAADVAVEGETDASAPKKKAVRAKRPAVKAE